MIRRSFALVFAFSTALSSLAVAENFQLGPLSQVDATVPAGKVIPMPPWQSKIYPGTTRDWWIYVPAQYNAAEPANLMVFQDGHDYVRVNGAWRVPVVFDNLIARGDMKPTIAVFINPGHDGKTKPASAWKVSNRGKEYNSLGATYARFLLEEILPQVQKEYNLTSDPEGWGIGGASSGGICAFTVAWERPDKFRRVFSTIGSFVDLAGGHLYPYQVRISERKPIRVFLQDGVNDLDNPYGNWPIANRNLAKALEFMHYDFRFVLGDGKHDSRHGAAIFPEAMKWLWR